MDRAYAEVNLGRLTENLQKVKNFIDQDTVIMAVVKADAYGHGVVAVARELIKQDVAYLGVASVQEALELRLNKIDVPILILSECAVEDIPLIIEHDLTQTVYSLHFIEGLKKMAGQKKIKIHLKIDTGMSRLGVMPEELDGIIEKIKDDKLFLEGCFTHLACADDQASQQTKEQLQIFKGASEKIKKMFPDIKYFHAANSAATFNFKEAHFDMVRIGIALYKNVLSFKSRVNYIKSVKAGTSISYGATYIAKKDSLLAIISVGYADGYNRLLSNKGKVIIGEQFFPVVGTVCMDMIMVDITDSQDIKIGDEVILIGAVSGQEITAEDIARTIGTIDYEVLCGISKRVPRYYI